MYLYETHLPVTSTEAAKAFYIDIVELSFAYRDPLRDIVFLWIGENRRSMLGLWGPGTTYGAAHENSHLAFAVSLPELLTRTRRLNTLGVKTYNFAGEQTIQPSVIGWMPSAQIYFHDADGHSLELIALLDDAPDPSFIGSLTEWQEGKARPAGVIAST
ncbi:MAG: VOC family protein [Terracidiphilus sp.]